MSRPDRGEPNLSSTTGVGMSRIKPRGDRSQTASGCAARGSAVRRQRKVQSLTPPAPENGDGDPTQEGAGRVCSVLLWE